MKKLYPSIFIAVIVISAIAASVKISDLTISTSPSTNTFIEIADMNDTPKSKKYLLTNLVTVAQGQASTNALTNTFVLKTGDTMTGTLTVPQIIAYSFRPRHLVMTHAGTVTLDFSTNTYQKLVLTGAVTLAFSNLETNRTYQLTIANAQATNCSYVLPAVTYMGYYPTNIVAGKVARWWFDVDPQTNSIVYATYAEQQ